MQNYTGSSIIFDAKNKTFTSVSNINDDLNILDLMYHEESGEIFLRLAKDDREDHSTFVSIKANYENFSITIGKRRMDFKRLV